MTISNPFRCEHCGAELESDDAVSIIEGVCTRCRLDELPSAANVTSPTPSPRPDVIAAANPTPFDFTDSEAAPPTLDPLPGKISSARLPEAVHVHPPSPTFGLPLRAPDRHHRRARDLAIGTLAGLLLTMSVTVYLLLRESDLPAAVPGDQIARATSLQLKVQPAWAQVRLDDQAVGSPDSSGRLTVAVPTDDASHWLEVSADGYHADRRPLSVLSGTEEVLVELVRKPYEVAVETDPPEAEIYINDQLRGFSPMTFSMLPGDPATLTVKHRGHEPLTRELAPPPRGERVDLRLALVAAGPVLRVETNPPGARVTADGVVQGAAPLTVQLDAALGGRSVRIAATAPGYDEAATTLQVPPAGAGEAVFVQLALNKTMVELELLTDPPGGRLLLDGRDLGPAPITARFEPSQTGRSIVVQAVLAGSHYGRQELLIPPPGEPRQVTIPMEFNAQRVVFVAASACEEATDRVLFAEQLVELIAQLTPPTRFAILARGDDGVEAWPGGLGTEAATHEQKIRAYDQARSLRPETGDLSELLRTMAGFQPTTVWLLAGPHVGREELRWFDEWAKGENLSVHVVRATSSPDDAWLAEWTAAHRGTLTILDAPAPTPGVVTLQPEE